MHTCNASIREAEAEGWSIQSWPGLWQDRDNKTSKGLGVATQDCNPNYSGGGGRSVAV
jgi:hypothetical protein